MIDGDTVRDEDGVFEALIARARSLGLCDSRGRFPLQGSEIDCTRLCSLVVMEEFSGSRAYLRLVPILCPLVYHLPASPAQLEWKNHEHSYFLQLPTNSRLIRDLMEELASTRCVAAFLEALKLSECC